MTTYERTWRTERRLPLPREKPGLSPATRRLALYLAVAFAAGYALAASCFGALP